MISQEKSRTATEWGFDDFVPGIEFKNSEAGRDCLSFLTSSFPSFCSSTDQLLVQEPCSYNGKF